MQLIHLQIIIFLISSKSHIKYFRSNSKQKMCPFFILQLPNVSWEFKCVKPPEYKMYFLLV